MKTTIALLLLLLTTPVSLTAQAAVFDGAVMATQFIGSGAGLRDLPASGVWYTHSTVCPSFTICETVVTCPEGTVAVNGGIRYPLATAIQKSVIYLNGTALGDSFQQWSMIATNRSSTLAHVFSIDVLCSPELVLFTTPGPTVTGDPPVGPGPPIGLLHVCPHGDIEPVQAPMDEAGNCPNHGDKLETQGLYAVSLEAAE